MMPHSAPPPNSPEVEESLVGAVLIDPECLREIDLEPDEFYIERNRWIYAACRDLRSTGSNIDFITVVEHLKELGKLGEVGGPARISSLINNCPTSMHAKDYAAIVREDAQRRKALLIASEIAAKSYDRRTPFNDFIPEIIDKLSHLVMCNQSAVHWQFFLSRLYDEIENACEDPKDIFGIPTGIYDFDAITGGLIRGEEIKLSGEPGVGKSILAMQMVIHAASKGHPGAAYHLEMRGASIARRAISAWSKVTTRAMRTGQLEGDDWEKITSAIDAASSIPIYMSDSSTWNTAALRVDLERLIMLHQIEWVLIDYEGLLTDNPDRGDIERSKIISSRLHGIIKDMNLAGLVINDMNKEGIKTGSGGQASLAGSARSLHDADSIWILKQDKEQPNVLKLISEKLREGDTGKSRVIEMYKTTNPTLPEFRNPSKGNGKNSKDWTV